jgi:O-acetyl-ADP-ribose deacetylase (regulator of RNase III)
MRVSVFIGDIADADAEAVCTSTNPRLSLVMGTGASIRGRGGIEILRECEAIVARAGKLAPGTAWATTAAQLPFKIAIHCVASDESHQSSEAIVKACTENALRTAADRECASIAMPVFATGHAHLKFDRAVRVMADAIAAWRGSVRIVTIVVGDEHRAEVVRKLFTKTLGSEVPVVHSTVEAEEPISWWAPQE